MTVGAVITYGFDRYQALALYNVAGMEPALLERLTAEEARRLLAEIMRG